MKIIKKYVDRINDEIHSAQEYAECYIEAKMNNSMALSDRYYEMAQDELKHVQYVHEIAAEKIETVRRYFTPTPEMVEMWNKAHEEYVKTVDMIQRLLSM